MAAVMFLVKWMSALTETDVWTVTSKYRKTLQKTAPVKHCVNANI